MRPSLGSLAAPRGLLGSTPLQPSLTPQLPPTTEGPVTAIRELWVPSLRPEGGVGASMASCVYTRPRLMVQQELRGACVHGRYTQDGSRAPPGQEATEPQWGAWVGLLTTTGAWSTSPLCPRLPQLQ